MSAAAPAPSLAGYRGRLAPSPTGYLHLGHARTFWTAQQRARAAGGTLLLRNEDLDRARCRPEFVAAMLEDLRWFGFGWQEGPDCGGPHAPYDQSARLDRYRAAFEQLRTAGFVYPCTCSRRDIAESAAAPHETGIGGGDEPLYSGRCRPERLDPAERLRRAAWPRAGHSWRFRVPDGRRLEFLDSAAGAQTAVAGATFGDFVVWRREDLPSYQLAVVVDDAAMGITEVVRGADLLVSTFRQLLLYEALGRRAPAFHHCPLVLDAAGQRLAKRHDSLSLRALRAAGRTPESLRADWRG
ncbi:MAG TPA: tRNA glutamyl-Q(34) synthetase GluQRS [Opitutaceae bacterium]|nr:tRNA glutamyl-Q(34) synthetase GluQRS [Opitutaceae bacterium]